MGYMQDVEQELRRTFDELLPALPKENEQALVQWIKDRLLESYRNGIEAGQRGPQRTRPSGQRSDTP